MTSDQNGRSLTIEQVRRICVVGSGTMGSQIAQQCALNGYDVTLTDAIAPALDKALASNRALLQARVNKGKMTQEQCDEALSRVKAVTSLEEAAGDADFVIEAIFEDLGAKHELYRNLDKICPPHTILASNSSTIVISKIAEAIQRKDKACNMHFFHPVLVMQLVEVVKGPDTSDETIAVTMELTRRIGREPVLMQKEVFGFIVNYILSHMMEAAMSLYDGGYASFEDIDKAVKLGLNHPMGPFELADFSGLDVWNFVMLQRYKETGDERFKPPAFLEEMVKEGRHGRKAGRGFYEYNK
ncbi:MAG: 3-hydroxyacyl-CoA dehydrogenase family protein [Chloroflexi bacterium]|uniref:3-hydroxyacyl-CoA dehydrogenase family protein n=1 Tax=Candidatus Chlorohelix allophototropha TaxID=3003348 RepID=A0A8T7M7Z9_9CHLR|nr:3-hydroxyacyl-CoA dehydrogenase family protein [Chloroflexota bacterium]WJW68196.1 3-hydroxyacyl-CoA dehydrogenase family protein [Chloroflexota bacterium L227-S17]